MTLAIQQPASRAVYKPRKTSPTLEAALGPGVDAASGAYLLVVVTFATGN